MEFNATFLVSAISFIMFVFIMNIIFYAPLEKIINEREKLVADTIDEANKASDEAQKLLQDRDEKLRNTAIESKNYITKKLEKANFDVKNEISKAKAESIKQINDYKKELEKQEEQISDELSQTIDDTAKIIMAKVMK